MQYLNEAFSTLYEVLPEPTEVDRAALRKSIKQLTQTLLALPCHNITIHTT